MVGGCVEGEYHYHCGDNQHAGNNGHAEVNTILAAGEHRVEAAHENAGFLIFGFRFALVDGYSFCVDIIFGM